MGDAEYTLGVQIERLEQGLRIGQHQYAVDLLMDHGYWEKDNNGSKVPVEAKDTPMISGWKHNPDSPLLDETRKKEYMSIVMKLMYLANQTRPDLTYSVNVLSSP
ncbi:hypothetical protein HDV05_005212, partial [Chytridiales sp. JEL 0842]